jgi:hypothetical protein
MKNDWEKKEKICSAYLSSKIFATSVRFWMRSTSLSLFQRSNWSPTYIQHLFHLEDTSLLFIFLSESVKVHFLPRVDTFPNFKVQGVKKSTSLTPGASNFHIWASWNNQLYARRASKKIYIGYWQTCQYSRIYLYSYMLYVV